MSNSHLARLAEPPSLLYTRLLPLDGIAVLCGFGCAGRAHLADFAWREEDGGPDLLPDEAWLRGEIGL